MHDFQLQGWHFRYDAYRTRAFYEQLPPLQTSLAENFRATFCSFPPELATLLKLMGANPAHPYQIIAGRCHPAEQEGEYILSYPIGGHAHHETTSDTPALEIASARLCVQPAGDKTISGLWGENPYFCLEVSSLFFPWVLLTPTLQEVYASPRGEWSVFPCPE